MSGGKILDEIKIDLRSESDEILSIFVDIYDNSLSRKWLVSLNELLSNDYHLEKNYCFMGFVDAPRNGQYILNQINASIRAINCADLGYHINDIFFMENTITDEPLDGRISGRNIVQHKLNKLHRYFEDLQGVNGKMSVYYNAADDRVRWHIRQLNLLCHEFETWALSYRKQIEAPDWVRPSQLMCWLNAPRFVLDEQDYELFGIHTINRDLGAVYVGVNKAIGKHHWEVFHDEGRDSRLSELTTSTLRSQTLAAGDFDIEWGRNPAEFSWQSKMLEEFREWLLNNGFNPDDPSLTIGHPQIGQVNLKKSFGTTDFKTIWKSLQDHLDVARISTNDHTAEYLYRWNDLDYIDKQIQSLKEKTNAMD